jgi:gas vesicle protein
MENENLTRDEDLIREQMTDTRTALSEKLEKLENKVAHTVSDATDTVQETVEAVKDTVTETKEAVTGTVEAVKETVTETVGAVKETIGAVKETVKSGVESVKEALNIPLQTQRHPWLVMGGAVAAGFLLGRWLTPRVSRAAKIAETVADTAGAAIGVIRSRQSAGHGHHGNGGHHHKNGGHKPASEAHGILSALTDKFKTEIDQLKHFAIGAAMAALRDIIAKNVPAEWLPQVNSILDGAAAKILGQQPESGDDKGETSATDQHAEERRAGERHRSGRHRKFDRQ